MKRLFVVFCMLAASPLLAFDRTPAAMRIGILRAEGTHRLDHDAYLQKAVRESLRDELRARGFDAYVAESTLEQISRSDDRSAHFWVEIVGDAETADYGGIGVGTPAADVSLGVLVSRVAADVRIYDGASLQLVVTEALAKRSTAVLPTSVGVGGRSLFAVIALPFIERAQVRSVARAAARELAARITNAVRAE